MIRLPSHPRNQTSPPPAGAASRPKAPAWSLRDTWDRMSNMRFALWLLLVMALGSILGVAVGDMYPTNVAGWEQLAERKAGPVLFPILKFFGMFDAFRSWWFRGLLILLTISLAACSIKRGRGVWRRALFNSWLVRERWFERYDHRATFQSAAADPLAVVAGPLRRQLYRVQRRDGADGARLLAADRGGPARFGPFLSHVGLLLLLVGGGLSTVFGLKTMLWLAPGETADTVQVGEDADSIEDVPLPFTLALNDFTVELNEQGMVKQYRSDVTVTPHGGQPFQQTISVNHPLRLGGFNFYQASYQPARNRVKWLEVAVLDTAGAELLPARRFDAGQPIPLGEPGLEAEVARFTMHAVVGAGGVQEGPRDRHNPAALFRILRDGQEVGTQWAFANFPGMHFGGWGERTLVIGDAEPAFATGLEVTRAPAAGLIWAGIVLCTLGLIGAFMVSHRQVWAMAVPDGRGGWTVHVAAFSNKGLVLFASDFRRWAEGWSRGEGVSKLRLLGAAVKSAN